MYNMTRVIFLERQLKLEKMFLILYFIKNKPKTIEKCGWAHHYLNK